MQHAVLFQSCGCGGTCLPCLLKEAAAEQEEAADAAVLASGKTSRVAKQVAQEWDDVGHVAATRTTKIPRAVVNTGVHNITELRSGKG